MPQAINIGSGRRGYWRYLYGSHFWIPVVEADWARGIQRDNPRVAIAEGALYDAADYLLHEPGMAMKRGGTAYAGPALGAASYAQAVSYAEFPAGSQLVGVDSGNQIYTITAGATTSVGGTLVSGGVIDNPRLRTGGTQHLLVFPCADGTSVPVVWDGSATPVALGGSPPAGKFVEVHKGRLVLAAAAATPNRLYFSPAVDITSAWDTSESWIDATHAVTGLASLNNALLIFSQGHVERITGTTPPPGSDMDLAPVGEEGCTDARSIIVQESNCLYANPRGIWLTNGAGFANLTTEGGIQSYWQKLLVGYDPTTWVIAAGVVRSFYVVTITDNTGNATTLMCNVPARAWWRLANINARMFSVGVGKQDELYYADSKHPRVVQMSGIFVPSAANKNDADGTPVQPMLETRAVGDGPDLKALGDCFVSYDMRDAATDSPTLAVQFARGAEATTYVTANESPFPATSDMKKKRFSTGGDSRAVSVKLTQTGPSAKTEIYSVEITQRSYPIAAEGQ